MFDLTPKVTTKELAPKAGAVYKNLAVDFVWQPLCPELCGIEQTEKEREYRLGYSVQTSPVEKQRKSLNPTSPAAALFGLFGLEAECWGDPYA
ncbi:hypothetical protein FBUS_09851 [Fasciolopsis buskii]|uniref:Uncharacterized protein n=1 Tax=Fasciolopsis buskii TaxID=27845 RepID=A0A8E0S7Q4_9TREM|nr:hypothetical protein FBUS_09851 [Fasciolopsis buski]